MWTDGLKPKSEDRLYGKYKIEKADGSPVDPNAEYFVLRLDTDPAARIAAQAYAAAVEKHWPEFAAQLSALVEKCTPKRHYR